MISFAFFLKKLVCSPPNLNQQFEKKPYNAVLGETHECYIQPGEDENSRAIFLAEQVGLQQPSLFGIFLLIEYSL